MQTMHRRVAPMQHAQAAVAQHGEIEHKFEVRTRCPAVVTRRSRPLTCRSPAPCAADGQTLRYRGSIPFLPDLLLLPAARARSHPRPRRPRASQSPRCSRRRPRRSSSRSGRCAPPPPPARVEPRCAVRRTVSRSARPPARPPPQANQVVTLKQKLEKEKANTRELTMVRPPTLIHSCAETRA
jgi:hypothetical protein